MALPSMRNGLVSQEYLRIAGGYGATPSGESPAGGLDVDNSGHVATDGDVTIEGDLSAGDGILAVDTGTGLVTVQDFCVEEDFDITGKDLTWSTFLHAADGFPTTANGCNAVTQTEIRVREVEYRSLGFPNVGDTRAIFNLVLPQHYPGGALSVDFYWTYTSGTAGGAVCWNLQSLCLKDDDPLDPGSVSSAAVVDTAIAVDDLHSCTVTVTPKNAASGELLVFSVLRHSGHATDTFNGTAQLIALRVCNV